MRTSNVLIVLTRVLWSVVLCISACAVADNFLQILQIAESRRSNWLLQLLHMDLETYYHSTFFRFFFHVTTVYMAMRHWNHNLRQLMHSAVLMLNHNLSSGICKSAPPPNVLFASLHNITSRVKDVQHVKPRIRPQPQ